jgi:hypothetical protein
LAAQTAIEGLLQDQQAEEEQGEAPEGQEGTSSLIKQIFKIL